MLCPLAKGNYGFLKRDGVADIEVRKGVSVCDGSECGWWDKRENQCGILSVSEGLADIYLMLAAIKEK